MKINDYLTRDEVAQFTAKSDLHAWRLVVGNWLFIAAIFAAVAAWPNRRQCYWRLCCWPEGSWACRC